MPFYYLLNCMIYIIAVMLGTVLDARIISALENRMASPLAAAVFLGQ
jgi:hypothetical protein